MQKYQKPPATDGRTDDGVVLSPTAKVKKVQKPLATGKTDAKVPKPLTTDGRTDDGVVLSPPAEVKKVTSCY
jgi:hypothetical protein